HLTALEDRRKREPHPAAGRILDRPGEHLAVWKVLLPRGVDPGPAGDRDGEIDVRSMERQRRAPPEGGGDTRLLRPHPLPGRHGIAFVQQARGKNEVRIFRQRHLCVLSLRVGWAMCAVAPVYDMCR